MLLCSLATMCKVTLLHSNGLMEARTLAVVVKVLVQECRSSIEVHILLCFHRLCQMLGVCMRPAR